jgi:hypothetical protein
LDFCRSRQDWFAGQIIAAMIGSDPANSNQRDQNGRLCGIEPARLANMTKNAYQSAEAMLQSRAALYPHLQPTGVVGTPRPAAVPTPDARLAHRVSATS